MLQVVLGDGDAGVTGRLLVAHRADEALLLVDLQCILLCLFKILFNAVLEFVQNGIDVGAAVLCDETLLFLFDKVGAELFDGIDPQRNLQRLFFLCQL